MAQLLDTTVNGSLEVTGNITTTALPTEDNHVVTKKYVDGLNMFAVKGMPPKDGNTNSAGGWKQFTTGDHSISLKKGVYLITLSATFTGTGTGLITVRLKNNGEEIDSNFNSTRNTVPVDSTRYVTACSSFLLTLDEDTDCEFLPEAYGSVTWTGRMARINIVKVS